MRVEPSAEQRALRDEFRAYLNGIMTDEVRAATAGAESGPVYRQVIRQMGRDGWLTPGWPVEYGGKGLDPAMQKILLEELVLAEAPFPFVTVNTVGPALMRLGTEAQKREILPRIASGDLIFAIGYTEPGAGSDLAALKTRAVRDGDDFVINGQKIFTSGAEGADYVFLAARTDPAAPKHKGITIFMMDATTPGFSVSPIWTVGGIRTNVTYYEDVRVPASMIIGVENAGWRLIAEQLNHERIGLAALTYGGNGCFDDVVNWARGIATPDGGRLIDQGWVQLALGECYALLRAIGLMGDRVGWEVSQGFTRPELASGLKVFGTEGMIRALRLLLDVMGAAGLVRGGSPGAQLRGRIEREYRKCQINTFGGGTAEVLRDMVAQVGFNMPRAR
ncbi:acyl-CoA dehydrogenase family protein [Sphingomonas lycopersici]|uniref:Acyl-CoA dehydrogenase family protein n=1 Tax=Sphingomonas lycopersici TaxID=2951807 RepID=A0AA42CP18_9SPHN|nr:acyl-CoA dehydrogenase family protein [Sphingomonas lycopersici]MCW6534185.1 acyl-CoA dehydrogenase family protein [Sphingomonas lycopersici]